MKLNVFVSSKTNELHDDRIAIKRELTSIGYETFIFEEDAGARTEGPEAVYSSEVNNCDIYIGIFREEYSKATEEEYDIANDTGKEILIYISEYDIKNREENLRTLLQKLKKHTYRTYDDIKQLEEFVKKDITDLLVRKFKEFKSGKRFNHAVFDNQEQILNYLQAAAPTIPKSLLEINPIASEIMSIWNAMGYKINSCILDGNTVNFKGEIISWLHSNKVYVRCVDGECSITDVNHVKQFLDGNVDYDGFIFTYNRILDSAKDLVAQYPKIKIKTQGEFYQDLMGPSKYIEFLQTKYDSSDIPKHYVNLDCFKETITEGAEQNSEQKEEIGDLEEYVDKWLQDKSKKHLSILGEFGSGKTWFSTKYAKKCLDKYLEDPQSNRLPILISLRDYAKSYDIKQMITDLLLNAYSFTFSGGFNLFNELNNQGKFILIFDGFDEMAQRVDYGTMVDNFWELASVAEHNSKVLLTCRTTHFRHAIEEQRILSGKEDRPGMVLPTNRPGFEIIHLKEFSEQKIVEVMTKRLNGDHEKAAEFWNKLKPIYDIPSIARKPVLIPMLIDVIPDIIQTQDITPAIIYHIYTDRWLSKSHQEKRTSLKTKWESLYFMTELAWFMIKTDNLKIFWKDLTKFLGEELKVESKEVDYYAYDLRNNTFLKRDQQGILEFTHKSMTEFFVAYKFALELGAIKSNYANDIPIENTQQTTLEKLSATFGFMSLNTEIMLFLKDMISSSGILRSLFARSKEYQIKSFLPSNLITLLIMMKESFDSEDISNVNMPGADLQDSSLTRCIFDNGNLTKSTFKHANLTGSSFANCNLFSSNLIRARCNDIKAENANLSNCNCSLADFSNAELPSCVLSNSKFNKAKLVFTNLEKIRAISTDFTECNMTDAFIENSVIDRCIFDESDLTNVSFKNSQLTNCTFHDSITSDIELTGCNLTNSIMEHLNLQKVGFGNVELINASLVSSDLTNGRITDSNLNSCNLSNTNLTKCRVENSNFNNTRLSNSNLSNSKFVKVNLTNAHLDGINSYQMEIDDESITVGAQIDKKTFVKLPKNFQKILVRDNPDYEDYFT